MSSMLSSMLHMCCWFYRLLHVRELKENNGKYHLHDKNYHWLLVKDTFFIYFLCVPTPRHSPPPTNQIVLAYCSKPASLAANFNLVHCLTIALHHIVFICELKYSLEQTLLDCIHVYYPLSLFLNDVMTRRGAWCFTCTFCFLIATYYHCTIHLELWREFGCCQWWSTSYCNT